MNKSVKKQAVQSYLDAVGRGDAETIASLVGDGFLHEFLGSTVFNTKKRTLADNREMLANFRGAMVSDGKFTIHQIVEEGDVVAAIFSGEVELKTGQRYDGVYAATFDFEGDKIVYMRELMDTKLADSVMA